MLWRTASLVKSMLTGVKINGKCASCHANHGQDLQYFNYSDNAVVQRSEFHGLTAAQGKQIAAYIQYANRDLPYAEKAVTRLCNPAYQPRPTTWLGTDEAMSGMSYCLMPRRARCRRTGWGASISRSIRARFINPMSGGY